MQYEKERFSLPHQSAVDDVMNAAKRMVVSGNNLQVPKAIPPPHGRPVKNAGKRRKDWYERDPIAKKRRSYSCSLCYQATLPLFVLYGRYLMVIPRKSACIPAIVYAVFDKACDQIAE